VWIAVGLMSHFFWLVQYTVYKWTVFCTGGCFGFVHSEKRLRSQQSIYSVFFQVSLLSYDEDGQLDMSTIVPMVDGGTEGFKGNARVIIPGISACVECTLDLYPPQVDVVVSYWLIKPKFHLARHVTSNVSSPCILVGCVEVVEEHGSTSSTQRARLAQHIDHVEPCILAVSSLSNDTAWQVRHDELDCSTRRTCRVVSRRDMTRQVEFELNITYLYSNMTTERIVSILTKRWKRNAY